MTVQAAERAAPPAPGGDRPAARRGRRRPHISVRSVLLAIVLLVLTVIFLTPLFWAVSTSFKANDDATQLPLSWLPRPISTEAYNTVLTTASQTPVLRWFLNSMLAGVANAILIVTVDAMAAYALARLAFRGKKLVFASVIGTLFVPAFTFLIPNFLIVSQLGWLDSPWAIIVPSAGGAFGVFFLRQFFLGLPRELEEAAVLDGANQWQVFVRVILPLARPGLATLTVLTFLTNWNDFLWPVYVLFSPAQLTLPAGLSTLQNASSINYPVIMAGAVIASVPVLVLFIAAQRHVIASVAQSGLKG